VRDIKGALTVEVLVEYLQVWDLVGGLTLQPGVLDQHCGKLTQSRGLQQQISLRHILWVPFVRLLGAAFASKKPKANQRGGNQKLIFQKQLLLGSTVLKAPWTLLLAFGF